MFKSIFKTKAQKEAHRKGKELLDIFHDSTTRTMLEWEIERCIDIIKDGADLTLKDGTGRTALMFAADRGDARIIKELLDHGAKTEERDNDGWTALMYTVAHRKTEHIDAARTLLQGGANASAQDNEGSTVLMWAIWSRYERIAEHLLTHGADTAPKAPNNYGAETGKTAEEIAINHNLTSLAKNIHEHHIRNTFGAAAEQGTLHARKIRRRHAPTT